MKTLYPHFIILQKPVVLFQNGRVSRVLKKNCLWDNVDVLDFTSSNCSTVLCHANTRSLPEPA